MNSNLSTISFDDIFKDLKTAYTELNKITIPKPIDEIISPLKIICNSVGSDKPYKALPVPIEYIEQWREYLKSGKKLEPRALRYLCWEPDVASNKKFLVYLHIEQISLSARFLQGIVRACHKRWKTILTEGVHKYLKSTTSNNGSVIEQLRGMLRKYDGPNRILKKWNGSLDKVLSTNGPELFAAEMTTGFKKIKEHTESWSVDVQSEFFDDSMTNAIQLCMKNTAACHYLFAEIMSWSLWKDQVFKKIVGEFIFADYFNNEATMKILQNFILSDNRLGDPRLPRNKINWLNIDTNAKNRFIQWLSQVDIEFFFDHVLPQGNDPHGRKKFWLNYKKSFVASRPMLCPNDESRLRRSKLFLTGKFRMDHIGKISTNLNSIFLLDFGTIVAVEFSVVGASYLYKADEFKKILPNFWYMGDGFLKRKGYDENHFKIQNKCIGRICHDRSARWKQEMSNLLSQHGIRAE